MYDKILRKIYQHIFWEAVISTHTNAYAHAHTPAHLRATVDQKARTTTIDVV